MLFRLEKEGDADLGTTLTNLEDMTLSEIGQTRMDKCCVISPIHSQVMQEKVASRCWGLERGNGELVFNGDRVLVGKMRKFYGGGSCTVM